MFDEKRLYCPRCGMFGNESEGNTCKYCNISMLPTDLLEIKYGIMNVKEMQEWQTTFLNTVIKPNPQYSEDARNEAFRKIRKGRTSANAIKCPHCGYGKFQRVSRRWSPLTGFFTNKVDRVCERCKKRF